MMKFRTPFPWIILSCLALFIIWSMLPEPASSPAGKEQVQQRRIQPELKTGQKLSKQEKKAARGEYFFRMLRNPATNEIPANIRELELNFARQLPKRSSGFGRYRTSTAFPDTSASVPYVWHSLGPQDVGGRTRALGIDQRDPNIVIAGGVSGGIWKSIDGGQTWEMKSDPGQNMSVSYLTQDPNNPDTWYYASGEYLGNSAADQGFTAGYHGTGIFRSTDNGETWSRLSSTAQGNVDTNYDSKFDYVSRIVISPTTGSIFIASNNFGIYRSTDGGSSWSSNPILGDDKRYMDINVAPDGRLVGVVSTDGEGSGESGVFISTDDGESWTKVTPNTFPNSHLRSVADFAPSDPSNFYVFTYKGAGSNQAISFHHFKLNSEASDTISTDDRSPNIPDFGDPVGGVNVQGGYNMVVEVKPDNPDDVFVGGINLFRSTDGFETGPANNADSTKAKYWIGGYSQTNNVSQYENQHPDQHVLAFHPDNPNIVWSGHDGGLSKTEDITERPVSWTSMDNGYITSQFYTVALAPDTSSTFIGGGTQDNGSPFIEADENFEQIETSVDASSGDGSYTHFAESPEDTMLFVSSQEGRIIRYDLNMEGTFEATAIVHPRGASGQLFIHPYVVDPNDGGIMYYPDQSASGTPRIWVNTEVDEVSNVNNAGASELEGWNAVEPDITVNRLITTLEVSRDPKNVLYFATYSSNNTPEIYRTTNPTGAFDVTDISIPDAASGAYVHDIALNPIDADEALVVLSNYGVEGIYHTSDGGANWTEVEGNLSENEAGNEGEGPSIRSAAIMPTGSTTIYMVGTSIGLYSTETLDAGSTSWIQESPDGIGNTVAAYLSTRITDGAVAVGSHGRGLFLGEFLGKFNMPGPPSTPSELLASASESSIELSWEQSPELDVAAYNVYEGAQPNALSFLDQVTSPNISVTLNENFESAYYAVTAVDNEGNESPRTRPVAALRTYQSIDSEWRLVGSPIMDTNGASYPGAASVFGYNGVYEEADEMTEGHGYWVKNAQPDSIEYLGGAPTSSEVQVKEGWNMIAGVGDTISVDDLQDPDGILSATPIKEYSGGTYQDADVLYSTGGYFVHAQSEGTITLQVDTSSAQQKPLASKSRDAQNLAQNMEKLTFSRNGESQALFLNQGGLSSQDKQFFLMPPPSPDPALDVRTADGFRLAEKQETELQLTAISYPVQVRLSSQKENSEQQPPSYRLVGMNDGEEIYHDLAPGASVILDRDYDRLLLQRLEGSQVPLTNELSQNYPNPFNPSTTIEYKIAAKGLVNLEVYNLLGRKVQTLVNQVQDPGKYKVTFNASSLSSGTYFVRIQAGEFQQVQKMTLIK